MLQPSPSVAEVAVTLAEATTVTEAATGAFTTNVAGVMEAMPAAKVVAEVLAAATGGRKAIVSLHKNRKSCEIGK